jgi:hypothetical protein
MHRPSLIERAGLTLDKAELGQFAGIRVIADVHGAFDAFDAAIRQAEQDNRFIVQLGDLIDRGPYSPLCVERMLDVEAQGQGYMLMGNHEVAFARFVIEDEGGAVTRQATLMQFEAYGGGLTERYVTRIQEGPLWIQAGNTVFVHAAFHPKMLNDHLQLDADLQEIAIHGYGNSRERRSGAKEREWVHAIPRELTVVVGHVVTKSGEVEHLVGRRGGTATFADTGFWRSERRQVPVIDIAF